MFDKEREFMEREEIDYSQYVYYDETSPTCLRWKVDMNRVNKKDTEAGYFRKTSAGEKVGIFLCINKKFYPVNKIVWKLHNKNYSCHMEHLDGDRFNARISNLESSPKSASLEVLGRENTSIDIRAYAIWNGIKQRLGLLNNQPQPTYIDASMYEGWIENVREFEAFITQLPNFNSMDDNGRYFALDKDLFSFNFHKFGYFPETVCFLPNALNIALHLGHEGNRSKNKGLPVGVVKDGGFYKAQITINGKPKYLGVGTIEECKELYTMAKVSRLEELILTWSPVLPEKVTNQLHLFVEHLKPF